MRFGLSILQIGRKYVPAGSLLYLSSFMAMNFEDPSLKPTGLSSLAAQDLEQLKATWKQVNYDILKAEFCPERWLKDDASAAKPSGLLTFGAGPHTCLGMSLFMTEAKALLALLAREYELQPESPEDLAFALTVTAQLTSNAGSRVRFQKLPTSAAAAVAGSTLPAGTHA